MGPDSSVDDKTKILLKNTLWTSETVTRANGTKSQVSTYNHYLSDDQHFVYNYGNIELKILHTWYVQEKFFILKEDNDSHLGVRE